MLSLAQNKSDPSILNYLGYSHRKAGRVLVGLGYYEEALRIDPDYTLVREYLGEAHLQLGDVAAAKDQLAEIEKRCGTTCEEYQGTRRADRFLQGLIKPARGGLPCYWHSGVVRGAAKARKQALLAWLVATRQAHDRAVSGVGKQPDRAVRRDVHVADAAIFTLDQLFLGADCATRVAVEPRQVCEFQ